MVRMEVLLFMSELVVDGLPCWSVGEVAVLLRCHRSYVYHLCNSRVLEAVWYGAAMYVTRCSVEMYLERLRYD